MHDVSRILPVRPFAPSWRQSLLGSAASLAFIGLSVPAFAQYTSPAPSTGTSRCARADQCTRAAAVGFGRRPDIIRTPAITKVDQSTLPKFTEPLRDTPQTIDTVSRQLMNDQGNTNLRDALRNVPGISLAAGEFGAQGDNFTIRGFTARNDIFIDGIRDFGSYYRDPFYLDSIEVLKGPASAMFGRGSTGGVVEQDSKQPVTYPITAGTASIDTVGNNRLTGDYNRELPELGHAAFRINLMGQDGGVVGRDVTQNNRFGVAPSLALGMGTPTRLTVRLSASVGIRHS